MSENCESCRFWRVRYDESTDGTCRRNPPGFETDGFKAMWPTTLFSDWCGEFQPYPGEYDESTIVTKSTTL